MTNNPYESPPIPGFQEANRKSASLRVPHDSTVRCFLVINQLVAAAIMGLGGVLWVLVLVVNFNPGGSDMAFISLVAGTVIGVVGYFQWRRYLAAILLTGLAVVGAYLVLGLLLLEFVLSALSATPTGDTILQRLFVFGFLLLIGAVLAVPGWVAFRAVLWQLDGVDLATLQPTSDAQNGDTKRSSVL